MQEWYQELKEEILRKNPMCELCGSGYATQLHHCLVHDCKRYHRLLTCRENLMPICEKCHTSLEATANNFEVKREFAIRQIQKGYDIGKWYRNLPLKVKERWLENL